MCREYVLSFAIMDEAGSFFAERNVEYFLPRVARNKTAMEALMADPGFLEASLKHSING